MKPNVTIIGVGGFIGSYLYKKFKCRFRVTGTYFNHQPEQGTVFLDITNRAQMEETLPLFDNSIILLLGGIKDVEKCEENYDLAYRLNVQPVQDMIDIVKLKKLKIKLIFFSTDYVFEGTKGCYNTDDEVNPRTNYGRTKVEAERQLMDSYLDYKIIRTSAVVGWGSPFFDWLVESIGKEGEIQLFSNVYFSPTPVNFLSDALEKIVEGYDDITSKILHIAGERRISRFEFGEEISLLLRGKARLVPVARDFSTGTFQADLSLTSSEYIRNLRQKTMMEYIRDLLDEYVSFIPPPDSLLRVTSAGVVL